MAEVIKTAYELCFIKHVYRSLDCDTLLVPIGGLTFFGSGMTVSLASSKMSEEDVYTYQVKV